MNSINNIKQFVAVISYLGEFERRCVCAGLANFLGEDGSSNVASTGLVDAKTIRSGQKDLDSLQKAEAAAQAMLFQVEQQILSEYGANCLSASYLIAKQVAEGVLHAAQVAVRSCVLAAIRSEKRELAEISACQNVVIEALRAVPRVIKDVTNSYVADLLSSAISENIAKNAANVVIDAMKQLISNTIKNSEENEKYGVGMANVSNQHKHENAKVALNAYKFNDFSKIIYSLSFVNFSCISEIDKSSNVSNNQQTLPAVIDLSKGDDKHLNNCTKKDNNDANKVKKEVNVKGVKVQAVKKLSNYILKFWILLTN